MSTFGRLAMTEKEFTKDVTIRRILEVYQEMMR